MKREEDFEDYPTLYLHLMVDDYEELFPEEVKKVVPHKDSADYSLYSFSDRKTELAAADSFVAL
jgi:hypothetical protein